MGSLTSGPRPEITPPQIVAMVLAGVPILAQLLHAFGVYDISVEQTEALSNAVTWAGVLAGALISGDALLRIGRNVRRGNVESALAAQGQGDRLEIVQSGMVTNPVAPSTAVPGASTGTTTTGFEEPL